MQLAPILRQALDLWQNPALTELSPEAFLAIANRVISELYLDLDLTQDACFSTEKSRVFHFSSASSREKDLNSIILDVSRVLRVESRNSSSTSDDDWREERVASFENWNDICERGDGNFVAFYGMPPSLKMAVNRDASNLGFRIVYQKIRDAIATVAGTVELPDIYGPALTYGIAFEMGEVIDDRSPEFVAKKRDKMPYLESRLDSALKNIEKWRRNQRGTSPTTRRAFNDRQGFGLGKRRFPTGY